MTGKQQASGGDFGKQWFWQNDQSAEINRTGEHDSGWVEVIRVENISGPKVRDSGDPLRLSHWRISTGKVSGPGPNLQNDLNDSLLTGGLKIYV